MYFLYTACIGFTFIVILKCIYPNYRKSNKTFDYVDNNYVFYLENIEFYKNYTIIKQKEFNKEFTIKKNLELNIDEIFDFMIVNYTYNNKSYKFYTNNSFVTFPLYSKNEIKTYVYINKITKAILEILIPEIETPIKIDILENILPYLGPNYNFYEDLNNKIYLKDIANLILSEIKEEMKLEKENVPFDKKYKIILYDSFNNEYTFMNDYLIWIPTLKL